jgi:hypothetical protein
LGAGEPGGAERHGATEAEGGAARVRRALRTRQRQVRAGEADCHEEEQEQRAWRAWVRRWFRECVHGAKNTKLAALVSARSGARVGNHGGLASFDSWRAQLRDYERQCRVLMSKWRVFRDR